MRIDGAQVEVELARVLGLECAGLELDDQVAAKSQVVEKEIDVEVLAAHFDVNLTADEGEAGPPARARSGRCG